MSTVLPFDQSAASLYGQFIQTAYSMQSNAPNNQTPPLTGDFPPGYKMAAWVQMKDFIIESTGPVFYGIVAQSILHPEQYVVAIRGTSDWVEWWDDVNALGKIPFKIPNCGNVAAGFARIYDTLQLVEYAPAVTAAPAPRLAAAGSFAQQIAALVRAHTPQAAVRAGDGVNPFGPTASVEITGHSLGAALATLYAMENGKTAQIANPMLCTFASPLVGDATFASVFNALNLTSWRVDNVMDLVTKGPPEILGFVHVQTVTSVNSAFKVLPTPGCWHSLATYLNLIDPTKPIDASCRLPFTLPAPQPAAAGALAAPVVGMQISAAPTPVPSPTPPLAEVLAAPPAPVFGPVAIDLYQGDNVQDTPGPLGGFARVKAKGIAFLLHKASEGVSVVDSRYQARRAAWMDGIPIPVKDVNGAVLQLTPKFAAYHFLIGEDPVAEARHFLATAQLKPGDDAAVDWEQSAGRPPPTADAVDAFCSVVEAALGFPMIVYSGNVAKEQLKGVDTRFSRRRLWLAQYSRTFQVQESWSFPWLWQDDGDDGGPGPHTIDGIDGFCDNSTVAGPMTVTRLHAEWGGKKPLAAPVVIGRASMGADAQPATKIVRRKIAGYGWKPDLPDQRDFTYCVPPSVVQSATGAIDLRAQCPPVYDQGQIGSCTANAIAAALEFDMMKQSQAAFTPSRLFIYYNERDMEGTTGSDSGAYIRDGIKSVANLGDCPETEWPYDGSAAPGGVFAPGAKAATRPSDPCYTNAVQHKALTYLSIDQNLADMKGCLASGYPFVFGFSVYSSFESQQVATSGILGLPGADESLIGGHAVMAVGYDDSNFRFLIRNSWGPDWGLGGYFYMPYSYLLDDNLANDFWTIRTVA